MAGRMPSHTFLVLDPTASAFGSFYDILASAGPLIQLASIEEALALREAVDSPVLLLDTHYLRELSPSEVSTLVDHRGLFPIGLVTDESTDDYLVELRRWGLLQVIVKSEPLVAEEILHFISCLVDPASGFGLHGYLHHTMEMYNVSVSTMREKNEAIENVINHFATSGFEVHELYDVRLILEEALNNALFHAFRTPTGEEKYSVTTLTQLDAKEKVRIEYGNNARMAGFSVTDSAGSLKVHTILDKLERQLNREGLFESSGRGLYLSRMLTTAFIVNVEEQRRTQVLALFDKRRHSDRPKPFILNFIGRDSFSEWRLDPDFD
jgi:anti-sigma regulatory factor (Ser/Thr protein kinase)